MIERALLVLVALFPISEIALAVAKRSRGGQAESDDRGSMRWLWFSILVGVALAFAAQRISWGQIGVPRSTSAAIALVVMAAGLAIRWIAIVTLGRFFTVDVAIHVDHAVVQSGLYRYVRHPSYTGLLVAFLGFGVWFSNWMSLLVLLGPITLGVLNRVRREEQALLGSLGAAYESYCARTRRFVPGLF